MRGDAHVRFGRRSGETGCWEQQHGAPVRSHERAVVFSFDEKTQVQALDRTQPSLPMKRGRGATLTHDYKRNGTTDLFAALNVGTGEVLFDTKKSHKATDVLAFFKFIDLHVPKDLDVHVVLDNLSAHKAPPVAKWLADPKRARWHLHFTPTSSSWLNLISGPRTFGARSIRRCPLRVAELMPDSARRKGDCVYLAHQREGLSGWSRPTPVVPSRRADCLRYADGMGNSTERLT